MWAFLWSIKIQYSLKLTVQIPITTGHLYRLLQRLMLYLADRAPNLGLVERFNFGLLPRFNLSLVARFNFGLPT